MNQPFSVRHKDAVVGAFVFGAIAILLVLIGVMLMQKEFFEERYDLNTRFAMGIGLNPGAPVTISGITIGTITDVRLNPHGSVDVRMRLKKSFQDRIRGNSLATVRRPNPVGDKIINISQGTPDSAVLRDGDWVQSQEPAELDDALTHVTKIAANLEKIISRLERGEGTAGALLKDRSTLDSINRLIDAGHRMLRDGDRFVGNLNKISETTDTLMGQMPALAGQVGQAVGSVKDLAQRADTLVAQLNALTTQIPGVLEDGGHLIEQADEIAGSVKSNWLVRRNLPAPKDSLIQFETRE